MTNEEYAMIVAKNLKRIFFEHDRSQADVARDLNISKQTLSSWMTGKRTPKMSKIDLLCHYFNCTREDIMEPHDEQYYLDKAAARAAQEAFDDPNLRALFDTARGSRPEDIQMAVEMLKRFKGTNPDG